MPRMWHSACGGCQQIRSQAATLRAAATSLLRVSVPTAFKPHGKVAHSVRHLLQETGSYSQIRNQLLAKVPALGSDRSLRMWRLLQVKLHLNT